MKKTKERKERMEWKGGKMEETRQWGKQVDYIVYFVYFKWGCLYCHGIHELVARPEGPFAVHSYNVSEQYEALQKGGNMSWLGRFLQHLVVLPYTDRALGHTLRSKRLVRHSELWAHEVASNLCLPVKLLNLKEEDHSDYTLSIHMCIHSMLLASFASIGPCFHSGCVTSQG